MIRATRVIGAFTWIMSQVIDDDGYPFKEAANEFALTSEEVKALRELVASFLAIGEKYS